MVTAYNNNNNETPRKLREGDNVIFKYTVFNNNNKKSQVYKEIGQ